MVISRRMRVSRRTTARAHKATTAKTPTVRSTFTLTETGTQTPTSNSTANRQTANCQLSVSSFRRLVVKVLVAAVEPVVTDRTEDVHLERVVDGFGLVRHP